MAAQTFDDRDGWIWCDGKLVPWRDAKVHVLTHALHYASAVFEGERAYGGAIFKSTQHSERLRNSARVLDFEVPYSAAEIDAAKAQTLQKNGLRRRLCAADRLARLGDDGRLGAAQQDPSRDRGVGLAELFRPRPADEGHPPRPRRISPARSGDRAVAGQGGGPLHDLHHLQASRRAARLRRRDDARLAGPRRRMHRRQHLLRQGRRHPHADRRLLP